MVNIRVKYPHIFNFTFAAQNAAIIDSIIILNNEATSVNSISIKISFSPRFAETIIFNDINIAPGKYWSKNDICPHYDLTYLSNFSGYEVARIDIIVSSNGCIIKNEAVTLYILDYLHYWGNMFCSKYLASYIIPHYNLDVILKKASELVSQYTRECVFNAYSSNNSLHIKMLVQTIYEAILAQRISFAYPIMPLRQSGQRIRLSTEVVEGEKKASCLDVALLFCSCLESIGLSPLLIIQDNHAFAGCWLVNHDSCNGIITSADDIINWALCDDPQILLIETTYSIFGLKRKYNEVIPFKDAIEKANKLILDKFLFSFALDIATIRKENILPLNQLIKFNTKKTCNVNDI